MCSNPVKSKWHMMAYIRTYNKPLIISLRWIQKRRSPRRFQLNGSEGRIEGGSHFMVHVCGGIRSPLRPTFNRTLCHQMLRRHICVCFGSRYELADTEHRIYCTSAARFFQKIALDYEPAGIPCVLNVHWFFSTFVTLFSRSKLAKVKVPTPLSPFFPLPPELASCATTVTWEKGEKEGL